MESTMNFSSNNNFSSSNDSKKHNGRSHSVQFKQSAVKLVTEEGYGAKEAAKSLGVPQSTLQYWVKIYGPQAPQPAETLQSLRLRVAELEGQNRRLLAQQEILKKATAFFASQSP
jgi:transposase